jgi:hypothetical protein
MRINPSTVLRWTQVMRTNGYPFYSKFILDLIYTDYAFQFESANLKKMIYCLESREDLLNSIRCLQIYGLDHSYTNSTRSRFVMIINFFPIGNVYEKKTEVLAMFKKPPFSEILRHYKFHEKIQVRWTLFNNEASKY